MNKTITKLTLLFGSVLSLQATAQVTTENFDGLTLTPNSYYKNTTTPDWQTSQETFRYKWDTAYGGYWGSGSSYTNVKDTVNGTYTNLYGNITGSGFSGNNYVTAKDGAVIKVKNTSIVSGFYITNTTYAWKSIKKGDSFARKFGDTTGTGSGASIPQGQYPDWFLLTAVGFRNGVAKSDTIKFYLADYRGPTSTDTVIKNWRFINCTLLNIVDSIQFHLSSSDAGSFGMNTPGFFSIDNFVTYTTVGINELESVSDISIFPNPVKDHLTINYTCEKENNLLISICDISGKEVLNEKQQNNTGYNRIELQTSALEAGVYSIQLSDGIVSKKLKFIKL